MEMETRPRADIENIHVGDSASCDVLISDRRVDEFAMFFQDTNPLHMDAEVAREYGFVGRVAHGLFSLGAISQLIGTKLPGPGSLWVSQELQFVAPVLMGDCITARVTVEQLSRAAGLVVLRTEVVNAESGKVVMRGVAKVKILGSAEKARLGSAARGES